MKIVKILIISVVCMMLFGCKKEDVVINEISYSLSGDDLGSNYSLTYDSSKNNIELLIQRSHSEKEVITTYDVDDSVIKELINLVKDSNYSKWKSYPNKEIYALDASIANIAIKVNNEYYNLSENQVLPNKSKTIIGDVHNYLLNARILDSDKVIKISTNAGIPYTWRYSLDNYDNILIESRSKNIDNLDGGVIELEYEIIPIKKGDVQITFENQSNINQEIIEKRVYKIIVDNNLNVDIKEIN